MNNPTQEFPILYEDSHLLVINKPAGVPVTRAQTVTEPTVQDWMESTYNLTSLAADISDEQERQTFINRAGLVHRLDKDTSGVLLLAKTPQALFELMRQFKDRETNKKYLALVHGKLSPEQGSLRVPLGRIGRHHTKFGVVPGGKMSQTEYLVRQTFSLNQKGYDAGLSLLELTPKTGRTHQLRVVLKHLNHPIVADKLYVGKKRIKRDVQWCPRQFLHAYQLGFIHPISKNQISVEAPLTQDLEEALKYVQREIKSCD